MKRNEVDAAHAALVEHRSPETEERLYRAMRDAARGMVKAAGWPEDAGLAHDIAAAALVQVEKFGGQAKFSSWFYRLAQNRIRDEIQRRRRRREQEQGLEGGDPKEDLWNRPVLETGVQLALWDEVERLTPAEREMLEGIASGETIEEVGGSLGLTRRQARRAWERLRERLRENLLRWLRRRLARRRRRM